MKKALAAGLLFIGLSVPGMAGDRMYYGDDNRLADTYLEVQSRTKDVVVLKSSWYMDTKRMGRSKIIVDCPNKKLVRVYGTHQLVHKADGNLWRREGPEPHYGGKKEDVAYKFACLGELPSGRHYF